MLSNETVEIVKACQTYVMYASLAALAVILLLPVFTWLARICDEVFHKWLKLDGFGRVITLGAIIMATMYGGSKNAGWSRVQNDGADTGITLVGVFTQTSNDVQVVGGVTTTNEIPLLAVMWTGGTVTASTPVSYRQSDTNDWAVVTPVSTTTYTDGTTNIMQFVLSEALNYTYWWVGEDTPAVVITGSSEIKITSYTETANYVRIEWDCENPLATSFDIYQKEHTATTWTHVTTVTTKYVQTSGFYVGKDRDWKVTSSYLEDGE